MTSDNVLAHSLSLTFSTTLNIFSYIFFIFLKTFTHCDGTETTFYKLIMVCVFVCVCVCVCVWVWVLCVYTYIWKEFLKYSNKCLFICTTYAHTHTDRHVHVCVYVLVCVSVCMCMCVWIYVHVHEWMNVCDVFSADNWISKHHFIFNRIPIFWHFRVLDICGSQDSCLETLSV